MIIERSLKRRTGGKHIPPAWQTIQKEVSQLRNAFCHNEIPTQEGDGLHLIAEAQKVLAPSREQSALDVLIHGTESIQGATVRGVLCAATASSVRRA